LGFGLSSSRLKSQKTNYFSFVIFHLSVSIVEQTTELLDIKFLKMETDKWKMTNEK